jgi:DNA adenine methylase
MSLDPVLRWAGSKRWIADRLADLVTMRLHLNHVYYEPFLGSGAVALALPSEVKKVLGDYCTPLSGLWWWLKRDPRWLHSTIDPTWENTEAGYYSVRGQFNSAPKFSATDPTPSAMMLWLNATCYNGLYRESTKSGFNVPWGKRKTIRSFTCAELIALSDFLRSATIKIGSDFEATLKTVRSGDVVYCDPPYDDVFGDYTAASFGPSQQCLLAHVLDRCRVLGTFVITTNADTPRIRSIYPATKWHLEDIEEPRRISCDATKRGNASCLVITSKS